MKIQKLDSPSTREKTEIVSLIDNAWPQNKSTEELVENFENMQKKRKHFISLVVRNNGNIVSHAGFFTRTIEISGKQEKVGCLAAVVTLPGFRNRGYGSKSVKAIFESINEHKVKMILFQTAIPEFYIKLGAKKINNRFITFKDERTSPWWDDHVMVFPESIDLKDYEINLCGTGF